MTVPKNIIPGVIIPMDDKVFNLLEKVYLELQEVKQAVNKNSNDIVGLEKEVQKTNIAIEQDIKPKIEVLFDGYTQNTKLLEDIREEVAKHEEVIIKRVK